MTSGENALKKQNKVAVARWVAAGKEHLVVLRPFEHGLILHTMFYAGFLEDPATWVLLAVGATLAAVPRRG